MDQETLINLVLVFFFLIITTLVRGLKARQQKKVLKKKKQVDKPSVFSFFHKIRDQIQESLQELEKQARQQQQKQKSETKSSDPNFWDELTEEGLNREEAEASASKMETVDADVYSRDEDSARKKTSEPQVQKREIKTPPAREPLPRPTIHPYGRRPSLRQAVVWGEILGKPVALRKNPNDPII